MLQRPKIYLIYETVSGANLEPTWMSEMGLFEGIVNWFCSWLLLLKA